MKQQLKKMYWNMPFISETSKEKFYYMIKGYIRGERSYKGDSNDIELLGKYRDQILNIPNEKDSEFYKPLTDSIYERREGDPKLIAYYLTQFHPTPENDAWWGKGVTEWTNVSHAVPQYVGHYQPRLPGELGFYDLRLKENMARQIELAQIYGVYGFSFYYYWFDGKRLLEKPLELFIKNKDLAFPFCLCWANQSWTKGFFGSSQEIIMEQKHNVESYKNFIHDIIDFLKDPRYIRINGKKVLQIYKPLDIPNCEEVITYWREYCRAHGVGEIYLIACWMANQQGDFIAKGFDAMSEFQLGALLPYCRKMNADVPFVTPEYYGAIYSYEELVNQKIYEKTFSIKHLYHSISPMWDNTPRKNNKGAIVFDGATPDLYKRWLKAIVFNTLIRSDLEDNLIFINAWNEWGEGAYLEPDRRYGYAYLQATLDAILESREMR